MRATVEANDLVLQGTVAEAHRGIRIITPTKVSRPVGITDLWRVFRDSTKIKFAMMAPFPGKYPKACSVSHCQIEAEDPLRFFVVDKWGTEKLKWYFGGARTIINPVIVEHGTYTMKSKEGCMSISNERLIKLQRYENVTLRFWTFFGPRTKKFYLQRAIIIQHEVDHMDGILIEDRFKKKKVTDTPAKI